MFDNTDKIWEKFGRNDPYFGVITHDKYKKSNLTTKSKEDFFKSGYEHVYNILKTIRDHLDPNYNIKKALDFGCGVGRMVIPLSEVAESVIGIDVSDSMLKEAKKNCESYSIKNAKFMKTDDNLSSLNGTYNFIHSFIVFQHIPVKRGEKIFENLLKYLDEGGVCVLHFTYAKSSKIKKLMPYIKSFVPFTKNFTNLMRGRSFFAPQMCVFTYNLNKLFYVMQKNNIRYCHTEYTHSGVNYGIILYFKKTVAT